MQPSLNAYVVGEKSYACGSILSSWSPFDLTGEDGLLTQKDGLNPGDVQFRVPGTRVFHPHPGCA